MTTGPRGVQAMSDILTANPKLDAFVIEGGWPLFGAPQPYRQLTDQYKGADRQQGAGDRRSRYHRDEVAIAKEGRVEALGRSAGRLRWVTRRRRS